MKWTEQGLFQAVGRTPLVKLARVLAPASFELYGKLELLNPGGSSKDRPALRMLRTAIESGRIHPDTVIVESSSGNLAISLAQLCNVLDLTFICVVDPKTTAQNLRLLRLFGAQIDLVEVPDPETGEYLPARLKRVKELLQRNPDSFWPNQYASPDNAGAHFHTTMEEILGALPRMDYLFCGVSTCGTIRGCAELAKSRGAHVKIVAVDAMGSAIFGPSAGKRLLPGLGAAVRPPLCPDETGLIHDVVYVSDQDCIEGCRRLLKQESILAGGSSGGVLMAVEKYKPQLPEGAVCAAILPDRGDRYLDTVFSDEWVIGQFGEAGLRGHHLREP
ncbi:2,3-diaminopropionate biosynthesis protein SbnA [Paenibacillus sp. y28]|uniref:2,3-diaminopropionate biosynthesis protein SbnA n=1 Tax=Paenibacillus sp. y28 TaxID=3129110 RepID=UPI003015894B